MEHELLHLKPCDSCKKRLTCPDDYICPEIEEWIKKEEGKE